MPGRRRREYVVLAAILLAYLAVYARALAFGLVWDDPVNSWTSELLRGPLARVIRKGEHARSEPATERMPKDLLPTHESYRPVSITSHWLDVHLFGDRPAGLHGHSLLLGFLSVVLAYGVGKRLGLGLWPPALWALHPLHVEVFAYVSARSDLLAGMFALLALLAALQAALAVTRGRRLTWAVLAALCQLIGLFAKESIITLPFALFVLAVAWGRLRASGAPVCALVAADMVYLPLRGLLMQSVSLPMAQGKAVLQACADWPGVCLAYLASFLAPFSLSPDRKLDPTWRFVGAVVLAMLFLGLALVLRRARGRVPGEARRAAGALAAFAILLMPAALGIRSIGALSDRYVFLPLFFLAVASAIGAHALCRSMKRLRPVLGVGLGLYGAILVAVTWMQVGCWRDEEALARHAVAMEPDNSAALYRLATVATSRGDFVTALPLLERATALDPTNRVALDNLSVTYLKLRRVSDAKAVLRQLLPLAGATDWRFWYNVASAQAMDGKSDKACAALEHALAIDPGYRLALQLRAQICPGAVARAGSLPGAGQPP
ncbi:MAG: tetratricopeptide repeat protein [Polyangia bacterium]